VIPAATSLGYIKNPRVEIFEDTRNDEMLYALAPAAEKQFAEKWPMTRAAQLLSSAAT